VELMRSLTRKERPKGPARPAGPRLPPARAWGAALLVAVGVYATWRLAARVQRRARPQDATRFLEAVERRLTRAGLRQDVHEPLERLSARLEQQGHPLAPTLRPVTRRYLEARFGGRPLREGEADQLLRSLSRDVERLRPAPPRAPPPA
jgi:protein-glutamine gamma-glutamyltransferase